jgi:hypothetical protein
MNNALQRWLIIAINKKIFWLALNRLKIYFSKTNITSVGTGYNYLVGTNLFA